MPSLDRRAVAESASSIRSFFSFSSVSVAADLNHRNAARQLGKTPKLLAVVVGVGAVDLRLDLGDTALDGLLRTRALDNGGSFLGDDHCLARPR